MLLSILLAACVTYPMCVDVTSINCATPTPTAIGDHDRVNVVCYRVYAKIDGALLWSWSTDVPYLPAETGAEAHGESAPVILLDFPIQRFIPNTVQGACVNVMVKAVYPGNVESAASNVINIKMPAVYPGRPAPYN